MVETDQERLKKLREYKAEWRDKNREHIREYNRMWYYKQKMLKGGK